MRKLTILIMLASLSLVPAAALAGREAPGDGALVVSNASGRLTVHGNGLIFGHLGQGTITVVGDYQPDDNTALSSVSGAKMKIMAGNVVYSGSDVRFLFPSGRYNLIVEGTSIDISAVGKGTFSAVGAGLTDDGSFAVDGGRTQSIDSAAGNVAFGKAGATATSAVRVKIGS